LPGVASGAIAELRPLTPAGLRRVLREGEPRDDASLGHMARTGSVSPGYFEALGIPVLQGRAFRPADDADAPDVAVVNRRLAELLWPGRDPLGQRIQVGLEEGSAEVVGVVPTGKYDDVTEEPQPALYRPIGQLYAPTATVFVRWSAPDRGALPAVRRTLRQLDPALPLFDIEPAEALLGRALWNARAVATLLSIFGVVGLLLAAVGIYGVVAHSVRERTREMGLRIALGARAGSVLVLALRRVIALCVAGALIGILVAALLARPLGSLLFGVGTADPLTFGGVAALLLVVAVAAAWLPARRATHVDPVQALRSE
jgi:predicted permease